MDFFGLALIFFARILDVSCATVRILLLVRGNRFLAACIGFFEVMVYLLVLGRILGGGRALTMPEVIAYCGGFASGTYFGSLVEEKIMNAFVMLDMILEFGPATDELVSRIRSEGHGATVIYGEGRDGAKTLVKVICRRKDVSSVTCIAGDRGFVAISDVRGCWGGYFRMHRK